jgi:hypothetical protein
MALPAVPNVKSPRGYATDNRTSRSRCTSSVELLAWHPEPAFGNPNCHKRRSFSARSPHRISVYHRRLELRFDGKACAVPEKVVVDLLDQGNLFVVPCYAVADSISVEIFEAFVVPLQTQAKVSGTKENTVCLSFFGTVVGMFVRCSLDCSGTNSVMERRTQQSGSGEVEVEVEIDRLVETQGEGLESLSC